MMKQIMALSVVLGLAGAGGYAAPLEPKTVAANAQFVMHVDADKLWASDFGKRLKLEIAKGQAQAKLDAVQVVLGLDPMQDIKGLTVYGADVATVKEKGTWVVSGKFDKERIITLLRAGDNYTVQQYNGHDIHLWVDKDAPGDLAKKQRWGSFARHDLLVAGATAETVKAALDVLDGKQPAMAAGAKVGGYDVTVSNAVLLVAAGSAASALKQNADAVMVQNLDSGCLRAWEENGSTLKLQVNLKATNAEAAAPIEQLLRGFQAMGVLQAQKNPELAKLAQALNITRNNAELAVEFSYATEALFNMVKARMGQHTPVVVGPDGSPSSAPQPVAPAAAVPTAVPTAEAPVNPPAAPPAAK